MSEENGEAKGARGIGYYLIALIMLAVLPMVAISAVLVWRQSQLHREALEESLQDTAVALLVAVDRHLLSYRVMLETLAESQLLADKRFTALHAYASRAAAQQGAMFVSLFDGSGRQIFNTLRAAGEPLPTPFRDERVQLNDAERPPIGDPKYLKLAFDTGQATYSDLTYGLVAGKLIFIVNVPVIREGQVQYVINAAFEPAEMTKLLKENPTVSGLPAVIFDRNGFVVGRWQDAESYVGKRVQSYERMKGKEVGVTTSQARGGLKVYYGYARSPVSGWGVNVGPERELFKGELLSIWGVGAALSGMGLLLGVLLALAVASRLRKSIIALADAAARTVPPRVVGLRTSEIAQVERALAQAASVRLIAAGEMAGAIAHEVNQPLTALTNYAHSGVALVRSGKTEELGLVLDRILAETHRASEIVGRLRDFFREGTTRLERLSVGELLESAKKMGAGLKSASRISFHFEQTDKDLPPLFVDRLQIELVLRNLLANAVESIDGQGKDGGQVTVKAKRHDALNLGLTIADSGPGVSHDLAEKVFAPFFSGKASGMGLGLVVSRAIVEAHDGALEVQPDGHGRFYVVLPFDSDRA